MEKQAAFRIAIIQVDSLAGGAQRARGGQQSNLEQLIDGVVQGASQGAALAVAPVAALDGYADETLTRRRSFIEDACQARDALTGRMPEGIALVTTTLDSHGDRVISRFGQKSGCVDAVSQVEMSGRKVELVMAHEGVLAKDLASRGADLVVAFSADPYQRTGCKERENRLCKEAMRLGCPIVYVNAAGVTDDRVLEGCSVLVGADGRIVRRLSAFAKDIQVLDIDALLADSQASEAAVEDIAQLYAALVAFVRGYVVRNGFSDVVLGLSGGVDSALVAALAADALGAEHVHAVMMPTRFSTGESTDCALKLANNFGIPVFAKPIETIFQTWLKELSSDFEGLPWDVTEENLQARIRGMLLMAYSNKFGWLTMATGNKSEAAVGYSTLYGDTAGAIAPIADVLKTDVYRLCRYRNAQAGYDIIPERILTRAPSAELREGQKDQDSLPDYAVLDAIIARYVEQGLLPEEIISEGFDEATVLRTVRMIHRAEFKRRQCATFPKIARVAPGAGWTFPIVGIVD